MFSMQLSRLTSFGTKSTLMKSKLFKMPANAAGYFMLQLNEIFTKPREVNGQQNARNYQTTKVPSER